MERAKNGISLGLNSYDEQPAKGFMIPGYVIDKAGSRNSVHWKKHQTPNKKEAGKSAGA